MRRNMNNFLHCACDSDDARSNLRRRLMEATQLNGRRMLMSSLGARSRWGRSDPAPGHASNKHSILCHNNE
jgi:hypothetical protein